MRRLVALASWTASAALVLLFLAQLHALWVHRVDYPLNDDWRYYSVGSTGMPRSLTLSWLLDPAKDAVHLSGKLVDWLVFRLVSHDYRVLASISFVLAFGGWLFASLALCCRAGRELPVVRVAALVTFVLPLAGAPYWVAVSPLQKLEPAIAYHQMLPMAGLMCLALLHLDERQAGRAKLGLAVVTTAFGSLAYSSGAVALLLFGATALALGLTARRIDGTASPLGIGMAVTATAVLGLALHIVLPLLRFGLNPVTEARAFQMTLPYDPSFWDFFLGLFDRAVLSTSVDMGARLRGIAVTALLVIPTAALAARVVSGRLEDRERAIAIVLTSVLVAVLGYAALVSYARAGFGQNYLSIVRTDPLRPSLYAHNRFFFWWITAVLPFVVLSWGLLLHRLGSGRVARLVTCVLVALALWPKPFYPDGDLHYLDSWNFDGLYQRDAKRAKKKIERMQKSIERNSKNRGFREVMEKAIRLEATFVERWLMDDWTSR